jgi:hypothetical protein
MNAAQVLPVVVSLKVVQAPAAREREVAVPAELEALFAQSMKARASFHALVEHERREFVRYIDEAKMPEVRERRAAIIAMSLIGLASDSVINATDPGPRTQAAH